MNSPYNYIEEYLYEIQAKGRYALTLTELLDRFDSSEKAIKQSIYRLKRKNRIAHVRKEFYVVVPPQYSKRGMIPHTLFIDDLMKYLKRDYYVGCLSAAALHGAAHQQPMEFQVMTGKPPMRCIKNKKLNVRFFVKSSWQPVDIELKKTETGYLNVSTPAHTAFDLVHYSKSIGGLNRILPVLEELAEGIRPSDLNRTAAHQKVSDLQRLGYLFERLGNVTLAAMLFKSIQGANLRAIPLSLSHKASAGKPDFKWKVIVNTSLDF